MILTDRAEALFASSLQPSDNPNQQVADDAIRSSRRILGCSGCAAIMAAEFGEHPETAAARMRWAISLAGSLESCQEHAVPAPSPEATANPAC